MRKINVSLFLLLLSFTLVISGSVWAADATPPRIQHEPIKTAYSDAHLIFQVRVSDDSALERVTLFFRTKGTTSYYAMNMNVVLGEYRAAIPATYMLPGVIQYYIEAVDVAGNVATWPAVSAAKNPQNIDIKSDNTVPEAKLVLPRSAAAGTGFIAVIALIDKANNVDPSTAKVRVNGVDVTDQAQITSTRVVLRVPSDMMRTRSVLEVEVTDIAGNKVKQRFSVWEALAWYRELRIDVTGGKSVESRFDTELSWGAFTLAANVRSDDPFFTKIPGQPTNKYSFGYNARLLLLNVGDISSTQASLAMNSMRHRGADLTLRLGPLSLQGVYGFPAIYVPNNTYERKVIGIRPAFDTRFLDFALNLVKIKDEWSESVDLVKDPEMNYVLDTQLGVGMFADKMSLQTEAAVSVYFPNARGSFDVWSMMGEKADNIPQVVRDFFEVPDILNGYKADLGVQVIAKMPLPWSEFTLRGFHFGPDYKTISGAGDCNVDGYHAKFATSRWLNTLQLTAEYERRIDNSASMVSCATAAAMDENFSATDLWQCMVDGQGNRKATDSYGGKLSLGKSGGANLDISGAHQANAPVGTAQPESISEGYTVNLKNVQIGLFGIRLRLNGLYSDMNQTWAADPGANKKTIVYKAGTGLDIGPLSGDLNYDRKEEKDAAGAVKSVTPSLNGTVSFTLRQPRLLIIQPQEVRLKVGAGQKWNEDANGVRADVATTYKGELETRFTAGLRLATTWQTEIKATGDPESRIVGTLRWRF
jgi:hypothetical protein